jgi:hypothetical protein
LSGPLRLLGFLLRALFSRLVIFTALLGALVVGLHHGGGAVPVKSSCEPTALKPPGFNPRTYKVMKTLGFQAFAFSKFNLYGLHRVVTTVVAKMQRDLAGLYKFANPVDP